MTQVNDYDYVGKYIAAKKYFDAVHHKDGYTIFTAEPAIGVIYIINNFISGHVRLRGKGGGKYPYKYLDMIDSLFGKSNNVLEVCSGDALSDNFVWTCDYFKFNDSVDIICDGQTLAGIPDDSFDRWRCDPPYNKETAKEMYGCEMPNIYKLLQAGCRVVRPGSLLFLLCAQNYQICPPGLKRIGLIAITVVPLNEIRCLNIYVKEK